MKYNHPQTPGFAATRQRLGLSQQQLANHLGISRSCIAMAEIGQRGLPVKALLKLAELEIQMASISVTDTAVERIEPGSKIPTLDVVYDREQQCQFEIVKLTYKLEEMTDKYKSLVLRLQLLDFLLENNIHATGERLLLQTQRQKTISQLSVCNLSAQTVLRSKIALLSAEANMSRAIMRKFF
jgi:transcriptional regulator with XRE-family HTH domain